MNTTCSLFTTLLTVLAFFLSAKLVNNYDNDNKIKEYGKEGGGERGVKIY